VRRPQSGYERRRPVVSRLRYGENCYRGKTHVILLTCLLAYARTSLDVISFEATIEDPIVFTRPWKISMPLYRRQERMRSSWISSAWSSSKNCCMGSTENVRLTDGRRGGSDMSKRFISGTRVLGMTLGFSLAALPVVGQVMNTPARSELARTPDGHPDLQGTYDLATMTPLERWPGDPPFLTKEQAEALQRAEIERRERRDAEGNRPLLPVGGDTSAPKSFFELLFRNAGGGTGYYNLFWTNHGSAYNVVDGQIRTSIVVDPPDGHVPPYNEAARERLAAARATPTSTAVERAALEPRRPAPSIIPRRVMNLRLFIRSPHRHGHAASTAR
jgi:hypothetical protein